MTDPEIIDALATRVMGWECDPENGEWAIHNPDGSWRSLGYRFTWNPLDNDGDSMMVVDHFRGQDIMFSQRHRFLEALKEQAIVTADGCSTVVHIDPLWWLLFMADRRRAIALAALRAVGMEV